MPVSEPQIEQRAAQPYAALSATVTMQNFAGAIDRGFPDLFGWLGAHGLAPAGAPFIRYVRVEMDGELEVEFGAPVAGDPPADERVHAGVIPAGRYVTLLHTGHYDELVAANARLQEWARERGIGWAMDGDRWRGRFEHYFTDPRQEPDPSRRQTGVAYLAQG
jgi:effector-binding domain-containing protein